MNALEAFSPQEFATVRDILVNKLLFSPSVNTSSQPKAVLLGGQSGAGKTTLHDIYRAFFNGNVAIINGDEYRSAHPRYYELDKAYGPDAVKYTAAWSGQMTEALIDALSRTHYNLVIEGTLRTSEVPLRPAAPLRERGYAVSLALMAVKPEISLLSCQIRYEQMRIAGTIPRATDPAHHLLIVESIVANLATLEDSELFDEVCLYNRARKRLYPAESGSLATCERASEALREVLFGPWTDEERLHRRFLEQRLETLREQ